MIDSSRYKVRTTLYQPVTICGLLMFMSTSTDYEIYIESIHLDKNVTSILLHAEDKENDSNISDSFTLK